MIENQPPVGNAPATSEAASEHDRPSSEPQFVYQGDDQTALQGILDSAFTPHATEVIGRKPLNARFKVVHQGKIRVYDLSYGTDVKILPVRPPAYYAIRIGHAGRAAITHHGRTMPFSPTIVSPGQVLSNTWGADAAARIMCVPRDLVDDAVRGELGDAPTSPVQFENLLDPRVPDIANWLRLATLFSTMIDSGVLDGPSLAAAHFEHLLVHTLLRTTQHELTDALAERRGTAGPAALRRAMAYCEDNAARPISVAQIAEAALVSTRTVHELFRTHLNSTPLAYLRRVRLAGAHADLVAIAEGNAAPRTVAYVAQRWGFPHTGRFSRAYREAYGRFPGETLRPRSTSPNDEGETDIPFPAPA
ncbi:MAG TPA: AraC family transcriptional regulator [Yinghuangia sp.]|nr:AraC family transcriptional regulator [Yinghuangia sp.]